VNGLNEEGLQDEYGRDYQRDQLCPRRNPQQLPAELQRTRDRKNIVDSLSPERQKEGDSGGKEVDTREEGSDDSVSVHDVFDC
jgi:hypothetical protein